MNKDEQLHHLSQVVVRAGERMNLSVQQWTISLDADDEVSDLVAGRIEAAASFSRELRADIETGMSLNDVYSIAHMDPPVDSLDGEPELDRVRRKLRAQRSETELWKVKALELARKYEVSPNANTVTKTTGSDHPHEH